MASKQDVANLIHSLPGADAWYGAGKLNSWAAGSIASVTYDKYLTWVNSGHEDWVRANVQQHTGLPDPAKAWKNNSPYNAIISFLSRQLANQNTELNNLRNSTSADNNPIATSTITDEIIRTQSALKYYKHLAGQ